MNKKKKKKSFRLDEKAHPVKLGILLGQGFVSSFFQTFVPQTSFIIYTVAQTLAEE